MRSGRPLRFLAATLAGWVGLRAFLLWPVTDELTGREAVAATPRLGRPAPAEEPVVVELRISPPSLSVEAPDRAPRPFAAARATPVGRVSVSVGDSGAPKRSASVAPPEAPVGEPPQVSLVTPAPSISTNTGRWGASAWAIARPSGTGGGLNASQLGGSQAGVRLAYALGDARRVALYGRIATPLEGRGREAALGVEWRPTRLPVRLFAERRFALGRGEGGPSAGVIAGAYEALPHRFRLEAYGQAGVIGRDRTEGFADGAARVTRAAADLGPATLDLGVGAWGGAQRGAERLDLGPTLGVAAPLAGRRVRLTLDYRARVAGQARPGSGPALSLGTDF